jgi:hypothetical protein
MYLAGVIGASGRGHHRGIVGHASVAFDGVALNKKIYGTIDARRNRAIEASTPMFISTGSCSSAVRPARCATSRYWLRSA